MTSLLQRIVIGKLNLSFAQTRVEWFCFFIKNWNYTNISYIVFVPRLFEECRKNFGGSWPPCRTDCSVIRQAFSRWRCCVAADINCFCNSNKMFWPGGRYCPVSRVNRDSDSLYLTATFSDVRRKNCPENFILLWKISTVFFWNIFNIIQDLPSKLSLSIDDDYELNIFFQCHGRFSEIFHIIFFRKNHITSNFM